MKIQGLPRLALFEFRSYAWELPRFELVWLEGECVNVRIMINRNPLLANGAVANGSYSDIPKKLKEYYDSLQDEAIPDRFLDLLERLSVAERAASEPALETDPSS